MRQALLAVAMLVATGCATSGVHVRARAPLDGAHRDMQACEEVATGLAGYLISQATGVAGDWSSQLVDGCYRERGY